MVPAPFSEAVTTLISSGDLKLLLSSLQTLHWSVGEVCDVLVGVALCYINSSDGVLLTVMGPACSLWSPVHTSPMMQEGFESQTQIYLWPSVKLAFH